MSSVISPRPQAQTVMQTTYRNVVCSANWKERLVEEIDPSELPQHWGGTVTDPDGDVYCRSKVRGHIVLNYPTALGRYSN